MPARLKIALRVTIILGLTAILLWLWGRGLDTEATGRALRGASPWLLAAALVAGLLQVHARALRWRTLLDVGGVALPPFRELVLTTAIGYVVTFAVPGRLGEIVRPVLLARRSNVPVGASLASIVLERLLDVATLLLLLAAFFWLTPSATSPEVARRLGFAGAVAGLFLVGFVAVHRLFRSQLDVLLARMSRWLPGRLGPRVEQLALTFLGGFDSLLRPGAWWRLPALSLVAWSMPLLALALTLRALSIEAPPTAPLLILGCAAAGIALPTPAGLGGVQAVVTWGLHDLLGVPVAQAAATAVLAHAVSVLPVLALGLYYAWREGLGVASIRSAAQGTARDEAEDAEPDDSPAPVDTDE